MKRLLAILLSIMLTLGGVGAFAAETEADTPADTEITTETEQPEEEPVPIVQSFHQLGVELTIPQEFYDLGACEAEEGASMDEYQRSEVNISLYSPALYNLIDELIMLMYDENATDEEIYAVNDKAMTLYKQLLTVRMYDEEEYDGFIADGMTAADIVGVENAEELGRQDSWVYIVFEPDNDLSELDEESVELYEKSREYIPAVRESLTLIPIQEGGFVDGMVPEFLVSDIYGNSFSNSIFEGKKVTLINIWGTFCGPCIDEMPDLGDLSRSLPENAQIVGLVIDIDGDESLQLAKDIVEGANADFTHLIAQGSLIDYTGSITAVPTSILVDENGQRLGELIIGTRSSEEYRAAIEEYLND